MANYPQLDDLVGVWKLKEVNDAVMGGYWRVSSGNSGLFGGGQSPSSGTGTAVVDQFNFASSGNINTNFGDLSVARGNHGSYSSFTKAFYVGGENTSGSKVNTIDTAFYSSGGKFSDFGDLTISPQHNTGTSSPED